MTSTRVIYFPLSIAFWVSSVLNTVLNSVEAVHQFAHPGVMSPTKRLEMIIGAIMMQRAQQIITQHAQ